MKSLLKTILLFTCVYAFNQGLFSQCGSPNLMPGLVCDINADEFGAPLLCDVACLDGMTGTLPDTATAPFPPFEDLCNGGNVDNLHWIAFVPGDNEINLTVIPENCTEIYTDDEVLSAIGIQAGIYYDCSFEQPVICMIEGCNDPNAESIQLVTDQLEAGHTYYLFIDGCGGSVCDYTLQLNETEENFDLPDITQVSNDQNIDLSNESICSGQSLTFTIEDFDYAIQYQWQIDPAPSNYPTGIHPNQFNHAVSFDFEEAGTYEISVQASNDCQTSNIFSFNVNVEDLPDEYFSDIEVCQECLPISLINVNDDCASGFGTPSIITEDPNGDGIFGWAGPNLITGAGPYQYDVETPNGCSFTQHINVVEVPLKERVVLDYFVCAEDFPVTLPEAPSFTFNESGEIYNITIDNGASSGCDSLAAIRVLSTEVNGEIVAGDCSGGAITLAFSGNSENIPSELLSYDWYDIDGTLVTDGDNIDSILIVNEPGLYYLEVTVNFQNSTCTYSIGDPILIDEDGLVPNPPIIVNQNDWNECANTPVEVIIQNAFPDILNYEWSIEPDVPYTISSDETALTFISDVANEYSICVTAINACGTSEEVCQMVSINEIPSTTFNAIEDICLGEEVVVSYENPPIGYDFSWLINNQNTLVGPGPHTIIPDEAGIQNITLEVSNGLCSSEPFSQSFNVVEPVEAPSIECSSTTDGIAFSWAETNFTNVVVEDISGEYDYELNDGLLTFNNLEPNTEIEVTLVFSNGSTCDPERIVESCEVRPCPNPLIEISIPSNNYCLSDAETIPISILVDGQILEDVTWSESSEIVNNELSLTNLSPGMHSIEGNFNIENCTYSADTSIQINPSPTYEYNIQSYDCDLNALPEITIFTNESNQLVLNGLDAPINESNEVDYGLVTIEINNEYGCGISDIAEILQPTEVTFLINGDDQILSNENAVYTTDLSSEEMADQLVWTWNNDTICSGCQNIELSTENNGVLCASIASDYACDFEYCMEIIVVENTEIFAPNIFSPNNDGINDSFTITSNQQAIFIEEVTIANRWGEKVYYGEDFMIEAAGFEWDGQLNGKACTPGVYLYVIKYIDIMGRTQTKVGDITIIR